MRFRHYRKMDGLRVSLSVCVCVCVCLCVCFGVFFEWRMYKLICSKCSFTETDFAIKPYSTAVWKYFEPSIHLYHDFIILIESDFQGYQTLLLKYLSAILSCWTFSKTASLVALLPAVLLLVFLSLIFWLDSISSLVANMLCPFCVSFFFVCVQLFYFRLKW